MKTINRNILLLVIGIMIVFLSGVGVNYLKYKNDNSTMPQVNLKNKDEKNKNTFAIMLEQSDGTYKTTTSTSFNQSGYTFNGVKSSCVDTDGKKVDNVLSYNSASKAVAVNTSQTVYCYIYFDKGESAALQLINTGNLWQSGLEGDGYRYVGTEPNNYICFGTTDKSLCTTTERNSLLYRIIGVFPDSDGNLYIKMIKDVPLADGNETATTYTWASANGHYYESGLNLDGSRFLTNTSRYVPSGWADRIKSWPWKYTKGENVFTDYYSSFTPREIFTAEYLGRNVEYTTVNSKVSIMDASDYALSMGTQSLVEKSTNDLRSVLKTGWLHFSKPYEGTYLETTTSEWTTSTHSHADGSDSAFAHWSIEYDGSFGTNAENEAKFIRPVFYLNANQVIASGTGGAYDPYILK